MREISKLPLGPRAPLLTVALALVLGPSFAQPAEACGGFFSETSTSEVAAMSDIRLAFVHTPGRVDQYVQIAYDGSAARFAWIYPVAKNPQVDEATGAPLEALDELTRPRITIVTPHPGGGGGGGGFGCGSADAAGGLGEGREQVDPDVKVWQRGQVGAFDYVVLGAQTADDLLGWLGQNGFNVPASTRTVVEHYLAQQWLFVAMKVSVQAVSGSTKATTTVRLSYAADGELRYPLRMVSLSSAAQTRFVIYLLESEAGRELGLQLPFSAIDFDREQLRALSSTTHNYDDAFSALETQAGARGLVREYASTIDDPGALGLGALGRLSVVRLRGRLDRSVLDQDLVFETRPQHELSSEHYLTYAPTQQSGGAWPLLLLLLLAAWRLTGPRWLTR